MEKKKIAVGMSGGVDSSVTALLLQEQGYEVVGITMQMWDSAQSPAEDAKRVAEQLGIQHVVLDFRKEFRKEVVDRFIADYESGRTPNPCIVCNRKIKWAALLEQAKKMGIPQIATGHYAKVVQHPVSGRWTIETADALQKDQTYVLYQLTQEQLAATQMPLGSYDKSEVRKMAEKIDLQIASKPDSQDICFIPNGDYIGFIRSQTNQTYPEGDFVDLSGQVLGRHQGMIRYTVGQRKGLGIAFGKPMYVHHLDAEHNRVVLSENQDLFQSTLYADQLCCMAIDQFESGMRLQAKIRYSHQAAWCTITCLSDGRLQCVFDQPQRAITPGQSVVFYDGPYLAGGGVILSAE